MVEAEEVGEAEEVEDLHTYLEEVVYDCDWEVAEVEAQVDLQVERVAVGRDVGVRDCVQVGRGAEVGAVHPVVEEVRGWNEDL